MKIYERIRYLREKLDMSQQELATKIGYKDKSAISKVERGERDINQSLIVKYANALGTTPAYLMGWSESEKTNSPSELELSEGEKMLLDLFRQIPEDKQPLVLQMIRAAASGSQE